MNASEDEDEDAPAERIAKSPEQVEALGAARRRIMEAQKSAVRRLVPALKSSTEANARELVDRAAEAAGVDLNLEVEYDDRPRRAAYQCGRITVWVENGIVVSASAG